MTNQPKTERDLHTAGVRTVAIPVRPRPQPRARPSSTAAASAGSSVGGSDLKAGSAISNAVTAGLHPAGRQAKSGDLMRARGNHPQPGQDRGYGQLTAAAGYRPAQETWPPY